MTAIIVDDVKSHIESIQKYVQAVEPNIEVIGTAVTIKEAKKLITELKPQLAFLDIQMERDGTTCFKMLEDLNKNGGIHFHIIFITAHGTADNQAKALQYSGMDFILKPLDVDTSRLRKAITKVQHQGINHETTRQQVEILTEFPKKRIMLELVNDTMRKEYLSNMIQIKIEDSITRIYVQKEERPFYSIKPLGFYEKLLAGRFFRVHHGVLVNKDYVQTAQKRDHACLLTTGEVILVSTRRWTDFLKWFNDNDES
jgi:two-component system, LytTR family, response regulator